MIVASVSATSRAMLRLSGERRGALKLPRRSDTTCSLPSRSTHTRAHCGPTAVSSLDRCVRLCRLFWPMLEAAQGHVVNIVGGAARTPDSEFLIGGSVNAAMANFSKGLSVLGKRDGVIVNAILPGLTETGRVEQLFRQRAEATGKTPEQVRAEAVAKEGLRRLAQPEEIAALALFLCSEHAGHIQGTSIAIDGGATSGVY